MGADPVYVAHAVQTQRRGPDECWPWTGGFMNQGYGRMYVPGVGHSVAVLAHRVAYEEANGSIPAGLVVDHTCHDPDECEGGPTCPHRACQNPRHLEAVTTKENKRRGNSPAAKAVRRDSCVHGHPYTPENTRRREDGSRSCRTCDREAARMSNAKRRGGQ